MLYEEIRGRGYRGALRTLQRFMIGIRSSGQPTAPPVAAARHITAWIMRPDDKLTDDDRVGLKDARARCADLGTLTELAHGFNDLVRQRRGAELETWINQAAQGPFPEVRGFATGLLSDFDAVRAGLTQHWSSGAVEGNINRVIMWNLFVKFLRGGIDGGTAAVREAADEESDRVVRCVGAPDGSRSVG